MSGMCWHTHTNILARGVYEICCSDDIIVEALSDSHCVCVCLSGFTVCMSHTYTVHTHTHWGCEWLHYEPRSFVWISFPADCWINVPTHSDATSSLITWDVTAVRSPCLSVCLSVTLCVCVCVCTQMTRAVNLYVFSVCWPDTLSSSSSSPLSPLPPSVAACQRCVQSRTADQLTAKTKERGGSWRKPRARGGGMGTVWSSCGSRELLRSLQHFHTHSGFLLGNSQCTVQPEKLHLLLYLFFQNFVCEVLP